MAALQVAKMTGAEVFATADTDDKVKYLTETFGLSRDRIFSSRDASSADGIMRATGGRGVDLALSSLSGNLLHATWECVAEFGKMVEIRQRDMVGSGQLDLKSFLGGRSYSGVYLDALMARKPSAVKE